MARRIVKYYNWNTTGSRNFLLARSVVVLETNINTFMYLYYCAQRHLPHPRRHERVLSIILATI